MHSNVSKQYRLTKCCCSFFRTRCIHMYCMSDSRGIHMSYWRLRSVMSANGDDAVFVAGGLLSFKKTAVIVRLQRRSPSKWGAILLSWGTYNMLGPLQCYFLSLLSCLRPLIKNRIDVPCGTYARSLKMADRRRSFIGKLSTWNVVTLWRTAYQRTSYPVWTLPLRDSRNVV